MIPRANIITWRSHAPWRLDEQVEQDLVLSRAIVEIFSDPVLSSELAIRGGTALHKLFLAPPSRYSEDIDFVQFHSGPIGPVMSAIHARIDPWLGKPKWKQSRGRVTFIYRFQSEIPPVKPSRLKIEINTREHFSVLGLDRVLFSVSNPWYVGEAKVVTYSVEELLGTKMRALYQRKKGRDLFDLATAIDRIPHLDLAKIAHCFEIYMDKEGARVSRAEFEGNLIQKLNDKQFLQDLQPLLASQHTLGSVGSFDVAQTGSEVLQRLVSHLAGETWKGVDGER